MEIQRITDQKDAATILSLEDPRLKEQVLNHIDCSKAEWVQSIVDDLKKFPYHFRLWAIKENGRIKAYMTAWNAIRPPRSKAFFIEYQNFFGMKDEDGELFLRKALDECIKWAKECGAKNIAIQTDYPHINSKFGFVEEGHSMVLKL